MEQLIKIPKRKVMVVDPESMQYEAERTLLDEIAQKNTRYLHQIYVGSMGGARYAVRRYRYSLMLDRYVHSYLS